MKDQSTVTKTAIAWGAVLAIAVLAAFGCSAKKEIVRRPELVVNPTPKMPNDFRGPSEDVVRPPERKAPLPEGYQVQPGDTMWHISGMWGDPFLWPMWWRHNRDTVIDPDLIEPGDVLLLPDLHNEEEKELARSRAWVEPAYNPKKGTGRRAPGF